MLAGNIVQVRPERKALSAAVGPTCCSGREQRSKTASVGGAILLQMKATLRKQLRVARNAMSEPDHRHRSVIRDRRHCRLRFYPLTEATAPGELGISVPRLRVTPVSLQWMNLSSCPWSASTARAGAWGWGVDTMIEPLRSVGGGAIGRGRTGRNRV
jgi:hypothetical protein